MITPKTDWENTDYYNVEDHNRIVDNLNELLTRYGMTETLTRGTVGELLTTEQRRALCLAYNDILSATGYDGVVLSSDAWFNAAELNEIESMILALNQPESKAKYNTGLVYDTGAVYGGGAHG